MKRLVIIAAIAVFAFQATPLCAAEDDAKAREQFDEILDAFNSRAYEMLESSIDKADLMNRVFAVRPLDDATKQAYNASYAEISESGFLSSIHNPTSDNAAELVRFAFEDGKGVAVIRIRIPNYQYAFLAIQIRHDRRSRLKIVDWYDSRLGQSMTTTISDVLITLAPNKASTQRLLSIQDPTDLQLFQATELLKAARDSMSPRFLEIYADLDEGIKAHPLIVKFAMRRAALGGNPDLFVSTLKLFVDAYSAQAEFAALTSAYYLQGQAYQEAYQSLLQFHQFFGVKEGAVPARLSALALATGNPEGAEKYALEATANEPSFELGWWSLLRARAAAMDYEGSLQPLTYLEDNFDHRLDAAKLRQDRFRGFAGLVASQEFKDWRAGRN